MDKTILPNFIVAGAPKAGTTSLYYYMRRHPDIYIPYSKEILFFDSSYHKGIDWYKRHFKFYRGESAIGDISPNYMHNPYVPKRIHKIIPNAKIIFILRNPVDRAYSHYWDLIGWRETNEPFSKMLLNPRMYKRGHSYIEFDILEIGFYFKHISRFLEYFSLEKLGIFLYDELKENPVKFINNICQFLGVHHLSEEEIILRKYNTSRINRSKLLGNILVSSTVREIVYTVSPEFIFPFVRRIYDFVLSLNSKRISIPPIDMQDRKYLIKEYKEDIQNLEKLTGYDLSHWLVEKETEESCTIAT